MQDRFVQGYIAGVIAGLVMAILNFILFKLGFSATRILDIPAIIFLGQVPETIGGLVIAQVIQLGHAAVMGILFAYLTLRIESKYITFKGATYGVVVWFLIFAIGTLYKIPLLSNNTTTTIFSYLVTSSIWGVVAALVLVWLEKYAPSMKESRQSSQIIAAPAYKRYSEDNNELLKENSEMLEKRLDEYETLSIQVSHKMKTKNRSFLSWFKFW